MSALHCSLDGPSAPIPPWTALVAAAVFCAVCLLDGINGATPSRLNPPEPLLATRPITLSGPTALNVLAHSYSFP